MIHGHGDDLYRSGAKVEANFSTNVWYEADTGPLCRFLTKRLSNIFHYPEPDAGSFRKIAAHYHEVRPANIIAGNGATELFYLVAHAFAGGKTLLPIPSFTEYQDACVLYNHRVQFLTDPDIHSLSADANLMFICNPNNPDGRIWSLEDIRTLLTLYPKMVLVIDESFIHFAPAASTAIPLLGKFPNLLIIRSMTKCYAIPGLRLGYMLGGEGLVELIGNYGQPWSVNALAIEAGKYLLRHSDAGLPDACLLLQRQQQFSGRLAAIPGFCPLPSQTSFFLIKTCYNSTDLKRWLLNHRGLLIRDASNFRGLNHHYFRINTLTDEKNALLIEGLEAYVGTMRRG